MDGVVAGNKGELIGQGGSGCILVAAIDIAVGGQNLYRKVGINGIAGLDRSLGNLLTAEVVNHENTLALAQNLLLII